MPFNEEEVTETVDEVINPLLKTDVFCSTARYDTSISADARTTLDNNPDNLHILKRITALLLLHEISSRTITSSSKDHTLVSNDLRSTTPAPLTVPSFTTTAN